MSALGDEEVISEVHDAVRESSRQYIRHNHLDVEASDAAIGMALRELEERGHIELYWETARGRLYEVDR